MAKRELGGGFYCKLGRGERGKAQRPGGRNQGYLGGEKDKRSGANREEKDRECKVEKEKTPIGKSSTKHSEE